MFFEADDSSNLPWNTTKTGMDLDSPYYKEVRSKMITMTRQVMDLLDKLKEEKAKDNPFESQTLNSSVEASLKNPTSVSRVLQEAVHLNNSFKFPVDLFNPKNKSKSVRISYLVSKEKFEAAAQHMGVNQPKEVGRTAFNYYFENEL